MLLSPLGPREILRPEREFGTELREHSLAAGPGPIGSLWPILEPSLLSPSPAPLCSQRSWSNSVRMGPEGIQRGGRTRYWSRGGAAWWLDQVRSPVDVCSEPDICYGMFPPKGLGTRGGGGDVSFTIVKMPVVCLLFRQF